MDFLFFQTAICFALVIAVKEIFDGRGGQANDMTMKCTHIEMCSYLVITMMLNWITCRYKHWNRLMFVYLTSKLPPAVHIASLNQNIALIGAIIWISASMNRYLS